MAVPQATPRFRRLAFVTAVLGPIAMWLRESDWIDFSDVGLLADVWFVAAVALLGAVVAIAALRRRLWIAGTLGLLLNGAVAALYGFIGIFFSLGGSR